jgi:hypothetical protein
MHDGANGRPARVAAPCTMAVFNPVSATRRFCGLAAGCLVLLGANAACAASEYDLKADAIVKIGRFVHWPPAAFANSQDRLRLCIAGRDDIDSSIQALAGVKLQDRSIAIVRLTGPEQSLRACHILFIGGSERERLPQMLNSIARSPVLTVSDLDGFTFRGGMVGLTTSAAKVHLEINAAAGERAGLTIGAQLRQMAALTGDREIEHGP